MNSNGEIFGGDAYGLTGYVSTIKASVNRQTRSRLTARPGEKER